MMELGRRLATGIGVFLQDLRNADRRKTLGGLGMAIVMAPLAIPGAVPEISAALQPLFALPAAGASLGSVHAVLREVSKARHARLELERADDADVARIRQEASRHLPDGDA